MSGDNNWCELFSEGNHIKIKKDGRIGANPVYETPQTVKIVEVSEMTDKDGEWPQAVHIRGQTMLSNEESTAPIDNIYIREAVERGDAEIRTPSEHSEPTSDGSQNHSSGAGDDPE